MDPKIITYVVGITMLLSGAWVSSFSLFVVGAIIIFIGLVQDGAV
jgi:hypothetical protein